MISAMNGSSGEGFNTGGAAHPRFGIARSSPRSLSITYAHKYVIYYFFTLHVLCVTQIRKLFVIIVAKMRMVHVQCTSLDETLLCPLHTYNAFQRCMEYTKYRYVCNNETQRITTLAKDLNCRRCPTEMSFWPYCITLCYAFPRAPRMHILYISDQRYIPL